MTETTSIQNIPICNLLLDKKNPRFGGNLATSDNQASLLGVIVETHGVNDLLTLMPANGYFNAEPVVAVQTNGKFTVVEGNRRLAAALILTGDKRAEKFEHFKQKWVYTNNKEKIASLKQFPVAVFSQRDENLIAYLGAKHIRGSKPWDSYAKAHWLFELMSASDLQLTVQGAAQLIGDQNPNTVKRVLEAYVLMRQLRDEKHYNSESSKVSGRGSNPNYPFSWVYTSIGYENIRNWIEINGFDSQDTIKAGTKVLNSEKALENSGKLVTFLFGSKTEAGSPDPVVRESRQIRLLNDVVSDTMSVRELQYGRKKLKDVWEGLRPVNDRLVDLFYETRTNLETINHLVSSETFQSEELGQLITMGQKSQNLVNAVVITLKSKAESSS